MMTIHGFTEQFSCNFISIHRLIILPNNTPISHSILFLGSNGIIFFSSVVVLVVVVFSDDRSERVSSVWQLFSIVLCKYYGV